MLGGVNGFPKGVSKCDLTPRNSKTIEHELSDIISLELCGVILSDLTKKRAELLNKIKSIVE